MKSEAGSRTSVPQGAFYSLNHTLAYFEDNLNISDLFPSAKGIETLLGHSSAYLGSNNSVLLKTVLFQKTTQRTRNS